jgi:hypothetical protein
VFRAGVGGERGSYLLAFRSDLDAAGSSCSGRTWTLLALPFRCERRKGERKAGWPEFPHSGKERARKEGESGNAGVPSQWEGTGQEEEGKAGWPGFPHSGKERARKKGESGNAGVPSQWEGTGQEEEGKAGKPGFPRNGRERAKKKGRKRESRGSLAVGGNGPGRNGESEKAGVPSQWEGTGQEEMEKAGKPGFPRNGRERARKKRGKRESRGSLAMGGNGPGRKGESGKAGVPSQWEGTGQEEMEKAGKPGFPRNGREWARKKWRKRESRGSLAMGGNGPGGESGLSVRSEAESESLLELG